MLPKTVLAIDPGSSKCGVALVRRDEQGSLSLLWRGIMPTVALQPRLRTIADETPFELIIIGGGTTSRSVVEGIRENFAGMATLVIDERDTTLQARERYWQYHERRGWRRLLPATLQVPPEPVDDFVALILAERVLVQG